MVNENYLSIIYVLIKKRNITRMIYDRFELISYFVCYFYKCWYKRGIHTWYKRSSASAKRCVKALARSRRACTQ